MTWQRWRGGRIDISGSGEAVAVGSRQRQQSPQRRWVQRTTKCWARWVRACADRTETRWRADLAAELSSTPAPLGCSPWTRCPPPCHTCGSRRAVQAGDTIYVRHRQMESNHRYRHKEINHRHRQRRATTVTDMENNHCHSDGRVGGSGCTCKWRLNRRMTPAQASVYRQVRPSTSQRTELPPPACKRARGSQTASRSQNQQS